MKCVVDSRLLHKGGIGTYLQNLIPALRVESFTSKYPLFSLKELFLLPRHIPPCDIYWTPHFNGPILPNKAKYQVVTIHDVHPLDHALPLHKRLYTKTILRAVIANADHIITVSEFSKRRILHYFPEVENKLSMIQPGCNHLDAVTPKPVEGVEPPFYLCVGNNKPHKNRRLLLEAKELMPDFRLVIADGHSPNELVWLYKNAQALIFPSTYEGWGLPPLEAMRLGCPVLASHAASIPEACGEGALYFNPYDVQDLCQKLYTLNADRHSWIEKGKKQAALWTWSRAAEQHRKIFLSLVHQQPCNRQNVTT